jgi:cysteine desulfurase
LAPFLCVALGRAAAIAAVEREGDAERLGRLAGLMLARLKADLPDTVLNGDAAHRLPGSLSLLFPGIDALELLKHVPELALSTGSACTSAEIEPSYVLRAIGLDRAAAAGSVRLSLGRPTTEAEIETAARVLASAVAALRSRG